MDVSEAEREPVCMMAYSHDGFGLGHLRRNTNIAVGFVQDIPGSTALLLTGSPTGAFFGLPAGVDFIKMPSIVKVDTGTHRPLSLRISVQKMKALRVSMIQNLAKLFKPHVFLVDHVPTGVWGELLPTLRMLRECEDPPRIVFGMRDIIDAPEVVRELWRRDDIYKAIRNYYDEVLIYGSQDVFDTASQFGLDAELPGRFRYCGYVCSGEPHKTRDQMREQLQLGKEKLIVVTAGGGRDGYPMLQACIGAFQLLGKDAPFEAILIAGPLMEPEQKECLEREANGFRIRVVSHVFEHLDYMNAADLVITMGGYNSLAEVLHLRKRSLVIPRPGPSAEQIMRAKLFAERGLIDVLYPHELCPKNLAERIVTDLGRNDYPIHDRAIDTDAGRRVAAHLRELVRARTYSQG